jgi:N-acetylneuraminate synthase
MWPVSKEDKATMSSFQIAGRRLGPGEKTYFIADIAANHDGSLERARDLIHLAAEAGADAAKFQHFQAGRIVSKVGFESQSGQVSHQARWKKSVFEVYQAASVPWDWTPVLKAECDKAGIHFFSTPYDAGAVDMLDPFVPAFKIGSGDITWLEALSHIASKAKPLLLATGASNLGDVQRAVETILPINPQLLLMQCNTNYTGNIDNFRCVRLRVLRTFQSMYPNVLLGLSDHTPGHAAVLGAIALGACAIEKHFTDDTTRQGPDHGFSLDPRTWREMVDRSRELELALGDGNKIIEANEQETVVIQRRCLRAARPLAAGSVLKRVDLDVLRPAPPDAIMPFDILKIIGRTLRANIPAGAHLRWVDLE